MIYLWITMLKTLLITMFITMLIYQELCTFTTLKHQYNGYQHSYFSFLSNFSTIF